MTFGLTPAGFNSKRLADLKQDLENAFIAEFGDVNVDAQSVFGQIIGVMSKQFADVWENLQDVYFSQYPNSAEGVALDNVVQYNGLTRLPATQTLVTGVCTGNEGTLIPANSLAQIPNANDVFYNPIDGVITANSAYEITAGVTSLAPQIYTMLVNNVSFIYSLPILTLTGDFVSGNIIVVTLNGVQLAPVAWVGNSDATNGAVADQILLDPAVAAIGTPDGHHINITPNLGYSVTINSVSISGGLSTPSYAVSFDTPSSVTNVVTYLGAVINTGSQPVVATNDSSTLTVTAIDADVPFSCSVQPGLFISEQSSPIPFQSQDYGPISCPANTLTQILSPVGGWDSINNPKAGVTGRFIETDAELRIRRLNSLGLLGNATVEAIRARLLQNVPNVVSVLIFENITMTQEDIDIVFSAALISGNQITITLNSRALPTITYATSNVATMTQLANLLALQPEVSGCSVTGGTNNTLDISINIFQSVVINDVTITGGASQADTSIKGGRPPKSFEAVVDGGTDADVAEEIWLSKPAGIQTYGNTQHSIVDSQGGTQVIFFSRPTPIYIWVQVTLTLYTEETFPANGLQLVQQAIYNYGVSLGIGVDVLLQRVLCQIFTVPGVASGSMTLAATAGPNDSPSFSGSDIPIEENEISVWDLSRIAVTI